jgi:carbon monoxide dehydrogenase subunit G
VFFTILKEINMKKFCLTISLLPFLFAATAYAHGPVRQKVEEKITINAPAQKVWGIIKEYGDMSWLPAVKSTTVNGGNSEGATRVLTLQDGGTITEELKKYDEGKMSYAYKITEMSTAKTITHAGAEEKVPVLPVDNYAASIDLEAKGEATLVTWKAGFYRAYVNNNPPPEMNEEVANTAVKGIFKAGLENLKSLAEK